MAKQAGMTRRGREMKQVLERLERSGMTLRAFAESEGMSRNTLGWWRRRLRKAGELRRAGEPGGFVEVVGALREAGPGGGHAFEVVREDGTTVRIAAGFDGDDLERLLGVLKRC